MPRSVALKRRRRRTAAKLALTVLAALSGAAGLLYGSVPSVSDAPARVRALDARAGLGPVAIARSARIARAIVAVEDERFYEHGAVDAIAIGRVLLASVEAESVDPGGSTITQQLAKVLYVTDPETLVGRLRAIALAAKLEREFSKTQILNLYLNAVYFGHGFYGVQAASRGFFGRPAAALDWNQASLLAGLAQSPSAYDPLRYPRRARARQREVLAQLVDNHVLRTRTARAIAAKRPRFAASPSPIASVIARGSLAPRPSRARRSLRLR